MTGQHKSQFLRAHLSPTNTPIPTSQPEAMQGAHLRFLGWPVAVFEGGGCL